MEEQRGDEARHLSQRLRVLCLGWVGGSESLEPSSWPCGCPALAHTDESVNELCTSPRRWPLYLTWTCWSLPNRRWRSVKEMLGQCNAPTGAKERRPQREQCCPFLTPTAAVPAAAAAKSPQSYPTLCDPIDGSPPVSSLYFCSGKCLDFLSTIKMFFATVSSVYITQHLLLLILYLQT